MKKKVIIVNWEEIAPLDFKNPINRKKLEKTLLFLRNLKNKGILINVVVPSSSGAPLQEEQKRLAEFDKLLNGDHSQSGEPIKVIPEEYYKDWLDSKSKKFKKEDILYITNKEAPPENDKDKYEFCSIEKTPTGRNLTPDSYTKIYKIATDSKPDVIVIGGGPGGFWEAIQLKLLYPDAQIVIKEKYEEFQRKHVLKIDPTSFKGAATNPALKEVIEDFSKKKLVPTSEIQEKFKKIAIDLGIEVEYEQVQSFSNLKKQYPDTKLFIDASGTRNITEKEVFYENEAGEFDENGTQKHLFSSEINHLVEIKYEATSLDDAKKRFLGKTDLAKLLQDSPFPISESVGRQKSNGKFPVSIRIFIDDQTYNELTNKKQDGPTFKDPYKLNQPEKIPPKLYKTIQAILNKRTESLGETRSKQGLFDDVNITTIPLNVSVSKKLYRVLDDGTVVVKVGDSSAVLPYFRAFNFASLIGGTKLAVKLKKFLHNLKDDSVNAYDKYKPLAEHEAEFHKLFEHEKSVALAKNMGLKISANFTNASNNISRTSKAPSKYKTIDIAKRDVEYCREIRRNFLNQVNNSQESKMVSSYTRGSGDQSKSFELDIAIYPTKENLKKAAEILSNIFKEYNYGCLMVENSEDSNNLGWDGVQLQLDNPLDKKHSLEDNRGSEFRVEFRFGSKPGKKLFQVEKGYEIDPDTLKKLMLRAWRELEAEGVKFNHVDSSNRPIVMAQGIITPFSYRYGKDTDFQFSNITLQDLTDNRIRINNANQAREERYSNQTEHLEKSLQSIGNKLSKIYTSSKLLDELVKVESFIIPHESNEEKLEIILRNKSLTEKILMKFPLDSRMQKDKSVVEMLSILKELKYEYEKQLKEIQGRENKAKNNKKNKEEYKEKSELEIDQEIYFNLSNDTAIKSKISRIETLFDFLIESKQSIVPIPIDENWITWLLENSKEIFNLEKPITSKEEVIQLYREKMECDPLSCQESYYAFQTIQKEKEFLKIEEQKKEDEKMSQEKLDFSYTTGKMVDIAFDELKKSISELSDPVLKDAAKTIVLYSANERSLQYDRDFVSFANTLEKFIDFPTAENAKILLNIKNEVNGLDEQLYERIEKFVYLTEIKEKIKILTDPHHEYDSTNIKQKFAKIAEVLNKLQWMTIKRDDFIPLNDFLNSLLSLLIAKDRTPENLQAYRAKFDVLMQTEIGKKYLGSPITELTRSIDSNHNPTKSVMFINSEKGDKSRSPSPISQLFERIRK